MSQEPEPEQNVCAFVNTTFQCVLCSLSFRSDQSHQCQLRGLGHLYISADVETTVA